MIDLGKKIVDRGRVARDLLSPRLPDAGTQLSLLMAHRASDVPPAKLSDVGFSAYSQTDEDGILLYLYAKIGMTNRLSVELCAGDGVECNSANLLINHGWHGLLVDGDELNVSNAQAFYSRARETRVFPPKIRKWWLTRDNVNELVREEGFEGEIDLFSLDLDGVDYWIWKGLDVIDPRVVVVEYQDSLGPEPAWTVPYADDFVAQWDDVGPTLAGASLRAFVELGKSKGYRLVGANRYGFNAFFVRNDLAPDLIPEVSVESCFTHPKSIEGIAQRYASVAKAGWIEAD